jgi:hypothetical protein
VAGSSYFTKGHKMIGWDSVYVENKTKEDNFSLKDLIEEKNKSFLNSWHYKISEAIHHEEYSCYQKLYGYLEINPYINIWRLAPPISRKAVGESGR